MFYIVKYYHIWYHQISWHNLNIFNILYLNILKYIYCQYKKSKKWHKYVCKVYIHNIKLNKDRINELKYMLIY